MDTASRLVPPTLFVSHEPRLLETRVKLLEEAGLFALTSNVTDFPVLLNEYQFEALILCNTLSEDEKRRLIAEFKRRYQTGRVVSIDAALEPQTIDADIRMQAPVMTSEWQKLCRALKNGAALAA